MSASKWSHVKFLRCGTVFNVPTSLFRVVIEDKVSQSKLKVNEIYSVFWSLDSNDTPRDIIAKGNQIVEIDEILMEERNRLLKDSQLKGYFKTTLLYLRGSEGNCFSIFCFSLRSKRLIHSVGFVYIVSATSN